MAAQLRLSFASAKAPADEFHCFAFPYLMRLQFVTLLHLVRYLTDCDIAEIVGSLGLGWARCGQGPVRRLYLYGGYMGRSAAVNGRMSWETRQVKYRGRLIILQWLSPSTTGDSVGDDRNDIYLPHLSPSLYPLTFARDGARAGERGLLRQALSFTGRRSGWMAGRVGRRLFRKKEQPGPRPWLLAVLHGSAV